MKENTRVDQIEYFRETKKEYEDLIKYRTEKDHISIYCDDEDLLYKIAANDPYNRIHEIHRPRDEKEKEILSRGESIVVNIKHGYKIVVRPWMHINNETVSQIYNYLLSLEDQIQMPRGFRIFLENKDQYKMTGNLYFYTSDPGIVTFIQMICPRFITGIHKLSKVAR